MVSKVPGKQHRERRPHRLLTNTEFMRISGEAAEFFQVSVDQMREPGNMSRPPHQLARQVVMYICWNSFDVTQEEIAERFGFLKGSVTKAIEATEADREASHLLDEFITGVENAIIARRIERTTRDRALKG